MVADGPDGTVCPAVCLSVVSVACECLRDRSLSLSRKSRGLVGIGLNLELAGASDQRCHFLYCSSLTCSIQSTTFPSSLS
jgi:hypothetical protein